MALVTQIGSTCQTKLTHLSKIVYQTIFTQVISRLDQGIVQSLRLRDRIMVVQERLKLLILVRFQVPQSVIYTVMNDERFEKIEQELSNIKERNVRVEAEKAWERSFLRIGTVMVMTYGIACVAFYAIGNDHPFRNGLIPTIGFFLSIQSIPFLKRAWVNTYISSRSK